MSSLSCLASINSNPRRVRVHPISGLFSNGFAGEGIPESPTYHTTLIFSELLLYLDLIQRPVSWISPRDRQTLPTWLCVNKQKSTASQVKAHRKRCSFPYLHRSALRLTMVPANQIKECWLINADTYTETESSPRQLALGKVITDMYAYCLC